MLLSLVRKGYSNASSGTLYYRSKHRLNQSLSSIPQSKLKWSNNVLPFCTQWIVATEQYRESLKLLKPLTNTPLQIDKLLWETGTQDGMAHWTMLVEIKQNHNLYRESLTC